MAGKIEYRRDAAGNMKCNQDTLEIMEETVEVPEEKYMGMKFQKIRFPGDLLKIGTHAFKDCQNLRSIVLPDHIQVIGEGAFEGCTNLREIYIPNSVVNIGHNAFEVNDSSQIIYCETKYPPEDWYYREEEEIYSEDYAGYMDASYRAWCGTWGTWGYPCTDDITGECYVRTILRKNPFLHVVFGCKKQYVLQDKDNIRMDIFSRIKDYPFKEYGAWENIVFNEPQLHFKEYIEKFFASCGEYPDAYDIQETKGALRHALEQYKEIFLKIWDSDFHREEYLFFGWDIYRCAMGWLKKYKIQDNEIRQMILREYHESENALYSFREKWRELLQKKNQELGELWMR